MSKVTETVEAIKVELEVADDIGNDSTKIGITNEKELDTTQPSIITRLMKKPNVSEASTESIVGNLYDELLVEITSNSIKRSSGFFLVGNRALKYTGTNPKENMNIKIGEKHRSDIPLIMTLSMNAATCVKKAYKEQKTLPSVIKADIKISSNIPASEYSPEKARHLEERFTNDTHSVIVHVGNKQVLVILNYKEAKVTQEGIPSLYAMRESGKDIFRNYVREYIFKKEVSLKEGISKKEEDKAFEKFFESYEIDSKKFFKNKKILHADIGNGTTEYIYTIGMKPQTDSCSGEKRGVGHATDEATKLLKDELNGRIDINRQKFSEILKDSDHNLYDDTVKFFNEAKYIQSDLILGDIEDRIVNYTNNDAELVAVYGGGSIVFNDTLYDDLINLCEELKVQVLWIPEQYAVDLNKNGLNILNRKVFFK
uniref:Actin-like protein N-terminal domain-containing protein n=1 Tax=Aeromonas sp. Ne-1 TaxID=1675689 RepID=A0A0H4J981_9GAMM|nr:ParM/StbA family protein [Aeromonas sp. Ne-1]AKO69695.1 hypothetical protein [Aeromonas sp. Ne-1]